MKQFGIKFIFLMAFLMSLAALAIDAIMPALNDIQSSLQIEDSNSLQLVISMVFLGMAFGLMLYGPLSDALGRKKPLYIGLIIFVIGGAVSLFSTNFEMMLFGRFLQGFGTASTRVIAVAMIRDCYSGAVMAKAMSLIMVVFILVPAIAPSLGQFILYFFEWKAIFTMLILAGCFGILALYFGQQETLPKSKRIPFSFKNISHGVTETLKNPISRSYTLASGLIFGAFVSYLSLAQQILQVHYNLGEMFSYYFGGLALFIGMASLVNSRIVERYGVRKLSHLSLLSIAIISSVFLVIVISFDYELPLILFLLYLCVSFFFIGLLFGNLNTLAIEPLGHIAGIANSVISAVQTLISVFIAAIVGQVYSGSVFPLIMAFFILSITSLILLKVSLKE